MGIERRKPEASGLRRLLRSTQARLAAFSGYGLSVRSPGVQPLDEREREDLWQLVRSRYEEFDRIENFGQAYTTLHLLELKQGGRTSTHGNP